MTDAAEIISASPAYWKMFIAEVFKKCNEIAQWEKDTGKIPPELPRSPSTSRKLPNYALCQNYSDGKFIPAEQTQVLDRLVNNYSIPKTSSTTLGSTSTMTDSLATGKSSTTTTTAEPTEAEASTSQGKSRRKMARSYTDPGYNKSASVLRKRIEGGQSNQALTLFAPLGMAEDLTKIQFTLCNEIKAELQAVKESVAAIPFSNLKKKIVETTTKLEERMCGLKTNTANTINTTPSDDFKTIIGSLIEEMRNLRQTVHHDILDLQNAVSQQKVDITQMEQSVKEAKQEIKQLLIEKIDNNAHNMQSIMDENKILKRENDKLKERMNKLEKLQLENNVLISGQPEEAWEPYDRTKGIVLDTILTSLSSLQIEEATRIVKNIEIMNCKRIGRYKIGRSRPISVTFHKKDDKQRLLENKRSLPMGVYVNEEFPFEIK